jgi:flagellin
VISGGTTFKLNMIEKVDGLDTHTMNTTGVDVGATVNGVVAKADGNAISVSTPALGLEMQLVAGLAVSDSLSFTITGGGALYQLGSNINTNNQANFGIQSVDTGHLGGSAGLLYQLASGNDADLATDTTKAADIVDQAVNQITSLRGRLGSFQKTTLETNIATLGDTVNALTNAQSTIQDADFASETANLTRAQILVQSGTAVLQIANRGPQQVLSLLQNL